jgi:hypothetical protein
MLNRLLHTHFVFVDMRRRGQARRDAAGRDTQAGHAAQALRVARARCRGECGDQRYMRCTRRPVKPHSFGAECITQAACQALVLAQ